MIKQPELAAKIIAAAKTAGLPVSVKTRLGYSNVDEWQIWLRHLLHQDLAALTVHLRTKKEMSKVPAHWELAVDIKKLRDEIAPNTLLIGNGDVLNKTEAKKLVAESGVDGIMIGRGIFTNIFAFEDTDLKHSQVELLELLRYHLDLFDTDNSTKPYETLKRFFKIYIRDFPGSSDLRVRLMESTSTQQAREILATVMA